MSSIKDVNEMHKKFDFPINDRPGFLPQDLMEMRLHFLLEEVEELAEACGYTLVCAGKYRFIQDPSLKRDLEKAFDGLLDLAVVTLGTADLMGFAQHVPRDCDSKWSSIWWEGWTRVMKANMAKVKGKTSRGHKLDLQKPERWVAPQFKDLLT